MWSCPYNFNHYSNWLGIGLTESGYSSQKDWYNQMYYGNSGNGLTFIRKDYYYDTNTIHMRDDTFEITGTMGTSHKTTAHIVIRPLNPKDIADSLKPALQAAVPIGRRRRDAHTVIQKGVYLDYSKLRGNGTENIKLGS